MILWRRINGRKDSFGSGPTIGEAVISSLLLGLCDKVAFGMLGRYAPAGFVRIGGPLARAELRCGYARVLIR